MSREPEDAEEARLRRLFRLSVAEPIAPLDQRERFATGISLALIVVFAALALVAWFGWGPM